MKQENKSVKKLEYLFWFDGTQKLRLSWGWNNFLWWDRGIVLSWWRTDWLRCSPSPSPSVKLSIPIPRQLLLQLQEELWLSLTGWRHWICRKKGPCTISCCFPPPLLLHMPIVYCIFSVHWGCEAMYQDCAYIGRKILCLLSTWQVNFTLLEGYNDGTSKFIASKLKKYIVIDSLSVPLFK